MQTLKACIRFVPSYYNNYVLLCFSMVPRKIKPTRKPLRKNINTSNTTLIAYKNYIPTQTVPNRQYL